MKKRIEYLCKTLWMIVFGTFFMQYVDAQNTIEADTVCVDELFTGKNSQVALAQCQIVDICGEGRYVIVSYHGKQGIYDMKNGENVTEIDLDRVAFSRHVVVEDSIDIYYFWAEKGLRAGIIGVIGANNHKIATWMDNPALHRGKGN